jgi:hypothetical protein
LWCSQIPLLIDPTLGDPTPTHLKEKFANNEACKGQQVELETWTSLHTLGFGVLRQNAIKTLGPYGLKG